MECGGKATALGWEEKRGKTVVKIFAAINLT